MVQRADASSAGVGRTAFGRRASILAAATGVTMLPAEDAAALARDPAPAEAALTEAARHVHQHFAQALADLVRRGQQAGDLRDGIDPHTAVWSLLSLLPGRGFRAAVAPDRARPEAEPTDIALRLLPP